MFERTEKVGWKRKKKIATAANDQWDGMNAFFFDCAPIGFSGKTLESKAKNGAFFKGTTPITSQSWRVEDRRSDIARFLESRGKRN